jgi:hypothetical protein
MLGERTCLPMVRETPPVREPPSVYRPRSPEKTAFYRLLTVHFDRFARRHEELYEAADGPLRPVVHKVVAQYLDCGRLENGFARVRCPQCKAEYFCAFSCQTRQFCSSCQQKRALLLAEKLREEILAPVHHRHWIFTIPVSLRQLFLRERRLLSLLPRCAHDAIRRTFTAVLGQEDARPGMVAAIQTFGSQLQWNPHLHCLVTDGVFRKGGEFVPFPLFDEDFERLLTETFRRLVLDALVKARRLSEDFRDRLLSFRHGGGFSAYGRHLILNEEPARLAHMARYAVRPPVAMDRVHVGQDGQVLLEIPPDHRTGATVLSLDPLEWLRRTTNQIPARGAHLVRYFGAYANRVRQLYRDAEGEVTEDRAEKEPPLKKSRASWARLLRKVFEVDPLTCARCGEEMKVISVITAGRLIDQLLRQVRQKAGEEGGDPFDARAPPAA